MAELNHEDRQNSGLFWDDVGFNFWLANQEWKEGDAPWDKPVDPNSRIFQALPAEVQEDILGGAYYRLKVKDLDILKDTASYQKTIWNENKGFSEKISFVAFAEINFQGAKQSDSGEYIKGERPVFYSSRYERTFRIPLVVAIWPPKDNPDTPYIYAHSADIDTAFWESDEFTEELSLNVLMPVMKEYFSSMDTFKKYASKILMPNTQGPKGSVVNPSRIGHNFQEQQEAAIYSGLIKNIEDKQIEVNQKY
ncbi:MAG: hypothetical protein VX642_00840 [Bdellovibrionota bacterium]|nr:hypothetical protein [Bdellovibrionota bacterium]